MAIAATTAITMSLSAAPADDKEVRQVRLYGQVFDSFTRTYLDSAYIEVLTTDKNGMAESGWLDYGKFKIEETSVPDHYVNSHFSTEVEINENEKTYVVEVENEPTQGKIQIAKTDKFDGKPISGVVFDIYNLKI